jgi:hypothetical protein
MDINEAEQFLDRMDKVFNNNGNKFNREEYEYVLDYVVDKHTLQDSRKNELLKIEGEIEYYQKIYDILINEMSKLSYFLSSEQTNHDPTDLPSTVPNGKGGMGYIVRVGSEEEDKKYQKICADMSRRAGDILVMAKEKIDTLKRKYEDNV